jgi:hypothetical protein
MGDNFDLTQRGDKFDLTHRRDEFDLFSVTILLMFLYCYLPQICITLYL